MTEHDAATTAMETAGWSPDLIPQLEMMLQAQRDDILHWQDEARRWMRLFARQVFAQERGGPDAPVVVVGRAALPPDVLAMLDGAVRAEMPRGALFVLLPPLDASPERDAAFEAALAVVGPPPPPVPWPEAAAAVLASAERFRLLADRLYTAEVVASERVAHDPGAATPDLAARLREGAAAVAAAGAAIEAALGIGRKEGDGNAA